MIVDYKAIAERVKALADEKDEISLSSTGTYSEQCEKDAANLRAVVSLLEEMAQAKPIRAIPADVAFSAMEHVAMANYGEREREASERLLAAEFYAYHKPQPKPTKAKIGDSDIVDWIDWFLRQVSDPDDFRWKAMRVAADEVKKLRAALVAEGLNDA